MAILQEGGEYGSVENLSQVNSGAMEQQPSLSADKSSLYFSSTRGASQDIFVARWTGETYAEPELVSGLVNTAASEAFPVISADGNELFFQREGAMHLATRSDADDPEAPFDEIVALGALDLASFEWPSSLSADGRVLFFAHTDGSTFSQIYTATREEPGAPFELPPVLVSGTTAGGVHPFISFDWPSAFPLTGPPRVRSSGS